MAELVVLNQEVTDIPAISGTGSSRPVLLIGFQKQGNLGIGYLASTLMKHGHVVKIIDFEDPPEKIVEIALAANPILIGFSLIFQFYISKFDDLMKYLRRHGIDCHFTMGGHFPSLSHEKTLHMAPELNSVVRFEGELTLLELVDCLVHARDWRQVSGVAYRENGEVRTTPLRHLLADLDRLPWPCMPLEPNHVLGKKYMPMIASRGCARTCSFCSIHMFYRSAPGKIVRTRKPMHVVEEMKMLHEKRGISIFLFQDDDFPLFGPSWRRWTHTFINELHRQELPNKVIWKISCRADAVERELFSAMRDAGLYLVYMGLESGSEEGLDTLHKQITVEQNLLAVSLLNELGIKWEFGFMLFDPSSTFVSVRENVQFLRKIVSTGEVAATFGKMLPYDGTPIKEELIREGRFRGDVCHPDYDFLDVKLDQYFEELSQITFPWVNGSDAPNHFLNTCWHEVAILQHLFPSVEGLEEYKSFLREKTGQFNEIVLSTVEEMADAFDADEETRHTFPLLTLDRQEFLLELQRERNAFVYENQEVMLKVLSADESLAAV